MLPPLANGGRGGNCGIAVRLNCGGGRLASRQVSLLLLPRGSLASLAVFEASTSQQIGLPETFALSRLQPTFSSLFWPRCFSPGAENQTKPLPESQRKDAIKLARKARAGVVLTGLGLLIFVAVVIWLRTTRTILAEIPMPMRAGVVGKDFTVDHDGPIHTMEFKFDWIVPPATASRLSVGKKLEFEANVDCTTRRRFSSSAGN
jgi:hypothetical protein